jgi:adenine-specific DNA-methyltransferase
LRYLGSKTSLLDDIFRLTNEVVSNGVLCDPFGGIGTVGNYFKQKGYQIITGDILTFAHCFQVARVVNDDFPDFMLFKKKMGIVDIAGFFNTLEPTTGWIVREYSEKRQYFSEINSGRIQSCVDMIWKLYEDKILLHEEYAYLIASLINSMDQVANTAGTYYAYLKKFNRKSNKNFIYKLITPSTGSQGCISQRVDAIDLVKNHKYDVLYLDPPYNERNYQRYYHLPENIATRTIPESNKTISGVYVEKAIKSDFNNKNRAYNSFCEILNNSRFKCLIFHYTDDGIIPVNLIRNTLSKYGTVEEFNLNCRAYTTKQNVKEVNHHIYRVINNI